MFQKLCSGSILLNLKQDLVIIRKIFSKFKNCREQNKFGTADLKEDNKSKKQVLD